MKFRLTFKTNDVLDQAYENVSKSMYSKCDTDECDCDFFIQESKAEIEKMADKFIRYGELITIEFDSELGTATVIPKSSF